MKYNDKYSSQPSIEKHIEKFKNMKKEEQESIIMNPGHVDEATWKKAKEKSMQEYGEHKWPFVMYLYEKMGGE